MRLRTLPSCPTTVYRKLFVLVPSSCGLNIRYFMEIHYNTPAFDSQKQRAFELW
jgi:hypothetical protein